ncbi:MULTISPECIES: aminopeptidase P family protein [unclassified Ruegeria]|uniref:aminopeptidase P family protein n=1 Tax=unclassified Ruegeria TaxID=2625375 RepID=UPI001487E769|nr:MULTISPECIES: aminopeptidase P family protein [unclassified Ruegeria]NOD74762.1 M24 family metallopeptidase [Ruegeria sp. HKCCD4332]NOD88505.1 M24 family metallopeptidase [Ruegeria sp. HKCCD4318]NOE12267.1 M24 family metallopeptidase [Ruegeria sp. HKCCD4318-2]NOG09568.1 aminopeptidase P family protein [Ruegeria sp. HKCCD4315]
MFQSFQVTARPEQGPPRLTALRAEMAQAGLDGFLIPRADAHQGEYVAPRDERLAWLTGFTGSAGFCAALPDVAGVFIDGRYRTQVKAQVADDFTPVPWPEVSLSAWLKEQLPNGGKVGFDPWLHAAGQISDLIRDLDGTGIEPVRCENLVDRIWADQPAPPMNPVKVHPIEFAGESSDSKITRLAKDLQRNGNSAAVLTLPDSIMWLLNIRGSDIAYNPVAHGFAILHADGRVDLFMTADKLAEVRDHLGSNVTVHDPQTFLDTVGALEGPVQVDIGTLPQIVADVVGTAMTEGGDPCALPKACKNPAEIAGSAEAHLRDAVAVIETLCWLDEQAPASVTETQVVTRLEENRRKDNALQDISFDTIAGTGPNGAIMHYRVTEETDSRLEDGHILVLDSGGQYLDGTTDITRTIAIGEVGDEEKTCFTRVLKGMIAMSMLRWPAGLAGRDIECVARTPLWAAGQDFNHGVGHGVGAYLSVHEGPQRLSRVSHVPLQPGMILSNEPGYYREGAFGIRIENLVVVEEAPALPGSDAERAMLNWQTLTFVPIDRRLILVDMLTPDERDWLNAYHRDVAEKIRPRLGRDAQLWLDAATAPV